MNVISVLRRNSARQIEPVSEVSFRLPTGFYMQFICQRFSPHSTGDFTLLFSYLAPTCNFQEKNSLAAHTTAVIILHRPAVTYTPITSAMPLSRSVKALDQRPSSTTVLRCSTLSESLITSTPGCFHPCVKTSLKPVASPDTLKTG